MESESVIYNGIKFIRYPESENRADRLYYRCHSGHYKKGIRYLHRYVYEQEVGAIPSGHHIHHIDDNQLNNDPSNLECISSEDHAKYHHANHCSDRKRENLERIRHLSKAWHSSEEGKKWHSENSKKMWENMPMVDKVCQFCSKDYQVKKSLSRQSKYCHQNCKQKARTRRLRSLRHND